MSSRHVTIIVLTWNGLDYTKSCLESLWRNTDHPSFDISVVDNGSSDGTLAFLKSQSKITLIENQSNLGFSRANNQAIQRAPAGADVVLLNNDTEIPDDQRAWLTKLQQCAYSATNIGVVGCRLRRPNGMLQHAGAYMPVNAYWGQQIGSNELDINQYPYTRDVESVVFACVYITRAVLDKVGGLSEDYFAYFEDTDYCNTARAAGFRTVCCGDVTIVHHENVSTKENKISHTQLFKQSQAIFKRKWAKTLEQRYDQKVVWHSTVSRPHGYAMTSKDIMLNLDAENVEVTYRYVYGKGTVFPVDEPENTNYYLANVMKERPIPRDVPHVVYGQGDAFSSNHGPYKIGFTMLEVTGIPKEWVRQANLMDEVWVPTEFNRHTFAESGVTRPLHIMPLGVDTNYFNPLIRRYPVCEQFKFLSVFEWGERKAPEVMLKVFNETFRADEPVVLLCKANCTDPSVDYSQLIRNLNLSPDGGRIEFIINKYVPHHQLGALYRSADCFVLTSRGEGWGMPILEAMACGLPAISTMWSAPTAFMTEANAYPLHTRALIDAVAKCPYYKGFKWADPDPEHLRHLLRHVFEHQDEARSKGARAAADVAAHWTIGHAARRIKQRLGEIGAPGAARRAVPVAATPAMAPTATIALDVSRAIGEQISGLGRHTLTTVQCLAQHPPPQMRFILMPGFGTFVHPEYGTRFHFPAPRVPHMTMATGPQPAFSSPACVIAGIDLVHSMGMMTPPEPCGLMLMTLYDLSFMTHPQFHTQETIMHCRSNISAAVQRGAWFAAISGHTRGDMLRLMHVAPERVVVVPCAYDDERFRSCAPKQIARVRTKYKLPERYLLFLASLEPRKNVRTAVAAALATDSAVPLVVAGAKGWLNDEFDELLARAKKRVIHIGYVPEDDLPAMYGGALCLVYPSLYEGFGLPVVEAMACGTPVITARNSALVETGGAAALFIDDACDVAALADAITRMTRDAALRKKCRDAGLQHVQRYQSAQIARQLAQVYNTMLGR